MNALLFNAVIAIAVLALGAFSLIVGAKSTQARNLRKDGDEFGYQTTIEDLVRMTAGAVVVTIGSAIALAATVIMAPAMLMTPISWTGDPLMFVVNATLAVVVSSIIGFRAGNWLQDKADKIQTKKTPRAMVPALIALAGVGVTALVGKVSAVPMNETMQPVTEILEWAGVDMMPAVLVLILAMVPLIMVMIGIRFAGGMLNGLLDGIRDIFSFRF